MLHGSVTLQTYMLKLAKSGEDGEKAFLVLESGSRFHTTQVSVFFLKWSERLFVTANV